MGCCFNHNVEMIFTNEVTLEEKVNKLYRIVCDIIQKIEKEDLKIVVTPQEFGALNNGVDDDSDAIQKAIDYGNEHKLAVWLGNYEYVVKKTIHINKNYTYLIGEGCILYGYVNGAVIEISGESKLNPCQNCIISGITVNGMNPTTVGLHLSHTFLISILGFQTNSAYIGVQVNEQYGTIIHDIKCYLNKYAGILYDSLSYSYESNGLNISQAIMDNEAGSQPEKGGIYWVSGEGLYIHNMELVRQNVGLLIQPDSATKGCKWGLINNCLFDLCGKHALEVNADKGDIYSVSFNNSWFATSDEECIKITTQNLQIDGVFFNGCQIYYGNGGVLCEQNSGVVKNIQIVNSQIFSNSRTDTGTKNGIEANDITQLLVSNNLFGGDEMSLSSVHKNDILLNNVKNSIITHNILYGYTNLGISVSGGSGLIIKGNINGYYYEYEFKGPENMSLDNCELFESEINGPYVVNMPTGKDSSVKFYLKTSDKLFADFRENLKLYIKGKSTTSGTLKLMVFLSDIIAGSKTTIYIKNVDVELSTTQDIVQVVNLPSLDKGINPNGLYCIEVLRLNEGNTYNDDLYLMGIECDLFTE